MVLAQVEAEAVVSIEEVVFDARTRLGLSQRALGSLLLAYGGDDVSGSAIGEWERGLSKPSRVNALALDRLIAERLPDFPTSVAGLLGYTDGTARPASIALGSEGSAREPAEIDLLRAEVAELRRIVESWGTPSREP